MNPIRILII